MKKQFFFILITVLSLSIFNGMKAFGQKKTEGLTVVRTQIKNNILLHFNALENKDQNAFKKSISQIFPSRSILTNIYSLSVMHYPHCHGSQNMDKARQIPLKLLKAKYNFGFDGKGNDQVVEEGFLVLIPLKEKLSSNKRLPFDAMSLPIISKLTSGYGFPPSFTMAFIVDAKGHIWRDQM